jgi:hypothetical protein
MERLVVGYVDAHLFVDPEPHGIDFAFDTSLELLGLVLLD